MNYFEVVEHFKSLAIYSLQASEATLLLRNQGSNSKFTNWRELSSAVLQISDDYFYHWPS